MSGEIYENIKVSNNYDKLTQTEKDIHLFMLKHIGEIGSMTIEEIASQCFCSTASVNRYAKAMGAKSYTHLKLELSEVSVIDELPQYEAVYSQLSTKINKLNLSQIDVITEFILSQDYIYIFGTGSSFILARYLQRLLSKLGVNAMAFNESQNLLMMRKINACIVISTTGETFNAVQVADTLSSDTTVIGITKKDSRVDKSCDYSIAHDDHNIVENSFNRELGIETFMSILMLITNLEYKVKKD